MLKPWFVVLPITVPCTVWFPNAECPPHWTAAWFEEGATVAFMPDGDPNVWAVACRVKGDGAKVVVLVGEDCGELNALTLYMS